MRRQGAGLALAGALLLGSAAGAAPRHHAPTAEASDTPEADPAEETSHVVRPGETLGGIANRAGLPKAAIIEANGLKAPYAVRTGQKLALPRSRKHTVARGERPFAIAMRYGVPFSAIAAANGLDADAPLKPGQVLIIPALLPRQAAADAPPPPRKGARPAKARPEPAATADDSAADTPPAPKFGWPLLGAVRRGYAPRGTPNYHDGIDIAAPAGTPVRAAAAGTVRFAGNEPQDYGRLVVIEHKGGWQSAYGFLGRIAVKKGEEVKAGAHIGLVGHSGEAKGDELHFELRQANKAVDPLAVLSPRARRAPRQAEAAADETPAPKPRRKPRPRAAPQD